MIAPTFHCALWLTAVTVTVEAVGDIAADHGLYYKLLTTVKFSNQQQKVQWNVVETYLLEARKQNRAEKPVPFSPGKMKAYTNCSGQLSVLHSLIQRIQHKIPRFVCAHLFALMHFDRERLRFQGNFAQGINDGLCVVYNEDIFPLNCTELCSKNSAKSTVLCFVIMVSIVTPQCLLI